MILDRISVWRAMFPKKSGVRDAVPRWEAAATREPELMLDLIRLGGILVLQPTEGGNVTLNDPLRLAYEAGRRDLSIELLSMMALTPRTLTILLEDNEK